MYAQIKESPPSGTVTSLYGHDMESGFHNKSSRETPVLNFLASLTTRELQIKCLYGSAQVVQNIQICSHMIDLQGQVNGMHGSQKWVSKGEFGQGPDSLKY